MNDVLSQLATPAAIAAAASIVLLFVRSILLRMACRCAANTETQVDDVLIDSVRIPSLYWCAAIGLYMGANFSQLPEKYLNHLRTVIYTIIIISVTVTVANLAGKALRNYLQKSQVNIPATGLVYAILEGTILLAGFLVLLNLLGVSIAPLLTALGVGGLAVALALQDTLANLFAGLHILMEKPIRIGDFVRLENGAEGYVHDITWRTTRVRMLPNNMVLIPNSKLAQSVITNYYLPEKRMSLLIPVGVSYDCDPDHIERILTEEAADAVGTLKGIVSDPPPFVRFIPGFADSCLEFTLICQVEEFVDQYLVQHELRKRIFKRFQAEGIEIPYPQRTVHIKRGKG